MSAGVRRREADVQDAENRDKANLPVGEPGAPVAISLEEAGELADQVRDLVSAGRTHIAIELLQRLHPADMASILGGLPRASRNTLLHLMSPDTVVWMLLQLNPVQAARFSARVGSRVLAPVLGQARQSQALAVLKLLLFLPKHLLRLRHLTRLLGYSLPEESIEEVLAHKPGTAGALMTPSAPSVPEDSTVETVREALRELGDERRKLTQVFVSDSDGRLVGEVGMVDLALTENDTPVQSITTPVVATVTADTGIEECARLQRHYNLSQLAVVEDGRLIGGILAEALLSATVEQDTRQMQSVASVAGETVGGPLSGSVRTRLPWLTVNLGTAFLAAATVALFESTLAQVVVLAAFLPVVAGQGGIGGTQTLTLIVRGIALGELVGISAARLLLREATLGLLHGVWLGLLVAGIAIVWKQNVGLGLVLGIAMLGNMVIAGTAGAAVPLFLRRIGVDPAVASAVVVTTFTDVFGFLLFLGIATISINLIV